MHVAPARGIGGLGATLRTPTGVAVAAAGVVALAGAAALGAHLLGRAPGSPASTDPRDGAVSIGDAPPAGAAPGVTTPPRTVPGPHLLALDKHATRPATSATDPASFDALLRADGPGWAAADGTISVSLPDGRVLWLFADTILDLPNADGTLRRNADFVRNSAVLHDGATATTLVSGTTRDASDFLKPAQPGQWYWPGHGMVEGNELVLFMSRMEQTTAGAPGWNMRQVGVDMVRLRLDDLSLVERVPVPDSERLEWGTAVVSDDTHTYVYGFENTDDDVYQRWAHVARVPKGELHGGGLEYWDGHGWNSDSAKSARIAKDLSNSFSVIRTPGGKWAMVSQELFFGTKLQAKLADSPQGPWSDWKTIDAGPAKPPGTISYNAQVHPAFTDDGTLLASWNFNREDTKLPSPSQLETYRPRFRAI
ncbi:MAG: hypothetical protein JWM86_2741, partial [Thermoleophilia bacterium]|nr:hypothetical protein [Thermoleophilia bacterium]